MVSGFPPGESPGGPDPPLSTTGGISPPCWQKKLKYFPYFTVISEKIDHFKHQNLKDTAIKGIFSLFVGSFCSQLLAEMNMMKPSS